MKWDFTDDEFKVLCNRFLDGWMPVPLAYTSRTPTLDEYERELSDVEAGLRDRLDTGLGSLFEVIQHPEVFIISGTWCDSDTENPQKRIRVHGARRGWRAVMITQQPGETVYHSGGFTLTECEPEALPALMVEQLPAAEAAGGPPLPILFEPPERDPYEVRQSLAFDSFDDTAEIRSRAFWAKPADWTGFIRVLQGRSIYGPRGVMETTMLWRDLPGDGRYLIELDEPEVRAVGADPARLVQRIGQRVDRVLRHMEERGEQRV
ncbi:ESX secretion-associated protein EspG [Nocardia sp. NBC_01503]|uniref:ESX secretion-associated protein EspG n=1 Tax=Nocardia sp. NBC_01503 TaxID=2975997 RepID=UPI002E7B7D59|nr:ESX secretion-associated protein EspG [Nocardia sp. NBC_01503]WTL33958.1 ESX secretion-associated protein EspG [Nocardia sp. NBC_01503]